MNTVSPFFCSYKLCCDVMSGNHIMAKTLHSLKNYRKRGELPMSVEFYALATYAFTAVISLVMMGVVVLLNKLMGGDAVEGEEADQ